MAVSAPELHARLREQLLQLASPQVVSGGGGPGVVGLVGDRHCEQYHQPSRESRHARERHLGIDVLKGVSDTERDIGNGSAGEDVGPPEGICRYFSPTHETFGSQILYTGL